MTARTSTSQTPARKSTSRSQATKPEPLEIGPRSPKTKAENAAVFTGRAATGDNGGGRKPKSQPAKSAPAKPKPKPKAQTLGQSGYRQKFGLSDAAIVAAIRERVSRDKQLAVVGKWSDSRILAEIGWATSVDGAVKKLRPLVAAH